GVVSEICPGFNTLSGDPLNRGQTAARTRALIAAARAMLSGQIGITAGAYLVRSRLSRLGGHLHPRDAIFSRYIKAIPLDVPVGSERLFWEPEAMMAKDRRLADLEAEYREPLLRACFQILRDFGGNPSSGSQKS